VARSRSVCTSSAILNSLIPDHSYSALVWPLMSPATTSSCKTNLGQIWIFPRQFFIKVINNKFQGDPSSDTCGQTDMTKLTSAFRQYANTPKKEKGFLHCGTNIFNHSIIMGTAVAQWLRCCATNRKVAGSIPNGVTGNFHLHNPSDRIMALVSTQPLTEMSTRSICWGVKSGRCVRLTTLLSFCAIVT